MNTFFKLLTFFTLIILVQTETLFAQNCGGNTDESKITQVDKGRIEMVEKIITKLKTEPNRRIPNLNSGNQGSLIFREYYEFTDSISNMYMIVQLLPSVEGKSDGSVSLSWSEPNVVTRKKEWWFISISLKGKVQTAFDPGQQKALITVGPNSLGKEFREFWQKKADEWLQILSKE